MTQSEQQLEQQLILQLEELGYTPVVIRNSTALLTNLKEQLEKFNNTRFTDNEFTRILNHLNKGDRFQKAKTLRDRFALKRDDESSKWVYFLDTLDSDKNIYQVTHQITQFGKYENRYDVSILINGLPLVQVELKRRGIEMKEAFNQIQRYHKHSFTGTMFEYTQIFVISNGVNTKYFSNNPNQNFEHAFYWTDKENVKISNLEDFAKVFFKPNTLSEMISEYIVLAEAKGIPMVLRPYQYYAVKEIENRVKNTNSNGYIWHTTGSGKTLTSFKASQILSRIPEVKKVMFVVDRKDLDIQTTKEFNSFSDGSVDGTNNTKSLITQLKDVNRKLIVTTIQKLDIAIGREINNQQFSELANEKVVIIFDECHRSQFGQTHAKIKNFFQRAQLFGFTGTPIFAENNVGGVTTKDVFEECLHKYIITNAISDHNVLGFAIEYVGKYKHKDPYTLDADIETDAYVEGINTKELLNSDNRLNKIVDYLLNDWKVKTKDGKFNAIFAVSSVEVLKKYYNILKEKKHSGFRVATIFTYQANEEESGDMLDVDVFAGEGTTGNQHSREFLENCIKEYNNYFGTNYSTDRFYDYYRDLQAKIKEKQVDLVLVVNMFLTGFDSPRLNTLYVDKNLKYHGLIQAFSRTNRLLGSDKPHGNIVSFRNLKNSTDTALALFGDENAKEIVFKKPYEEHKLEFEEKLQHLKDIAPTIASVDQLRGEEEKAMFVKSFRDLLRAKSSLETYAEFNFNDLGITEQEFLDYQSKYLDIYEERRKAQVMTLSVLDEIDFEIELTLRDIVNFDYIIRLLAGLKDVTSDRAREKQTEDILKVFDRDVKLRKKRELIKKFIEENLPLIDRSEEVERAFNAYWESQKHESIQKLAEKENIPIDNIKKVISTYFYTQKLPRSQEIADMLPVQPKILERNRILERIKNAIVNIFDVFEW